MDFFPILLVNFHVNAKEMFSNWELFPMEASLDFPNFNYIPEMNDQWYDEDINFAFTFIRK